MGDPLKPNGREVSSLASLGGLEDYTAPEEVGGAGAVKIVGTVRVVQGSAFELTKYYDAAKTEVDKKEGSADKPFVTAYVRTKNFLDVKNHPVYSSALEEWTREVKKARNNLVDNGKEKADLITQVYNIVGFFSVFQGVVLTAVTQLASGSPPKCQKVWFPILLTLVATLLAVVALSSKFVALGKSEKDATRFRGNHDVLTKRVDKLLAKGTNFKFCEDVEEAGPLKIEHDIWFLKICTLVALLLVTSIFVLSYLVILCDKFLM